MAKSETQPVICRFEDWQITLPVRVVDILTTEGSLKGVEYFLDYGLRQSLQDSVAGMEKQLKTAVNDDGLPKYDSTEIVTMMHDAKQDRFARAMAGDIRSGARGPRLQGVEAIMRDVADEFIRAIAAKKGKSLPKGAAYADFRATYLRQHEARIRAEAERRMALTAEDDDILDQLGKELEAN